MIIVGMFWRVTCAKVRRRPASAGAVLPIDAVLTSAWRAGPLCGGAPPRMLRRGRKQPADQEAGVLAAPATAGADLHLRDGGVASSAAAGAHGSSLRADRKSVV